MLILVGENNNQRRRVPIHLVQSSDGITPLTGQTGTCNISINYGAPKASANSIVEIDSSNMPGDYYLELTPLEVMTLGMGLVRCKTGSSAEYVYPFQVVAYDPFNKLYGEGGTPQIFSGADVDYKRIEKMIIAHKPVLSDPEPQKPVDFSPLSDALQAILSEIRAITIPEAGDPDLQPVMAKIDAVEAAVRRIEIPEPTEVDLKPILERLDALDGLKTELTGYMEQCEQTDTKLQTVLAQLSDALDMSKMRAAFENYNRPAPATEPKAPRFEKPKLI